jgi:predicted DNA-binding WGR domain protein
MSESRHLRRIDPDRNMARFYTMSVQPTLFSIASCSNCNVQDKITGRSW